MCCLGGQHQPCQPQPLRLLPIDDLLDDGRREADEPAGVVWRGDEALRRPAVMRAARVRLLWKP
jgi:hypothetical protein